MKFIYMTHSLVWYAVRAYKIIGPAIFKETNSDHYIKLHLTQVFGEVTEEEKMYENPLSLKELKDNFQRKTNISRQELQCVSRGTVRRYQACLEVADAGFVCNKLLMTAAVLRNMIVTPLCIFTTLFVSFITLCF
jgi:hypothetical protein